MNNPSNPITRRKFISQTGFAAAAVSLSGVDRAQEAAADKPLSRNIR